jgi:hypothetical protein
VSFRVKVATSVLACVFLGGASSTSAQQKPQWMPGQVGLNAGILPSPGFTYVNMDINYDAGSFNDRNGNAVPVTGNYNVWLSKISSTTCRPRNSSEEIWDLWSYSLH